MATDTRNHKSLVDPASVEWLTDLEDGHAAILNSLLHEAEEFHDDDLDKFVKRFMMLLPAKHGKRAKLMAQVAMRDEALKDLQEATFHARHEPPRGP